MATKMKQVKLITKKDYEELKESQFPEEPYNEVILESFESFINFEISCVFDTFGEVDIRNSSDMDTIMVIYNVAF